VLRVLDAAMREAESVLEPRYLFERFPVEHVTEEAIQLCGDRRLAIAGTGRTWGVPREVGLGVCTIGEGLELRVDELLARREFPVAFMLDSVGWVAVEALATEMENWICSRLMGEGMRATARLSPGHTGWDIWDQRVVFDLVPAHRVGMRLNDYCVMIPGKSLSFGMGFGPAVQVDQTHKCRRCDLGGCAYRLAPYRGPKGPSHASAGDHHATLRRVLDT
jgi:hypothetical protein